MTIELRSKRLTRMQRPPSCRFFSPIVSFRQAEAEVQIQVRFPDASGVASAVAVGVLAFV